jgi:EAL domain-containing protein (putative c-di-GMP-specific phosphodiesterase class I)/ActR/RegA family two-component response regulator
MKSDNKLLILDDDALIAKTISVIGESAGFETEMSTSADDFFRLLGEWDPSHIALDLVMPDMDGVEVLVELARRECRARILITSGVGSRVLDAARRSAVEHGLTIAGVMPKPFSPASLRQLLLEGGKDQTVLHTPDPPPNGPHSHTDISEDEFARAIENAELELAYQPKINCADGELAGFEALVRWNSPERGMVPPSMFIPLAESCNLMTQMTRLVISQAMHWFSKQLRCSEKLRSTPWRSSLVDKLTLSINISARSLDDAAFIEFVHELCTSCDLDPDHLIFELTETSAMEDPVASLDLLTRLRMKGFQLSIDDFGTGYSSMLQLVRLPFSEIKVDKSFVMSAARSEESRTVIRSIVELGHSLGLRTTAEGVEDIETMEYLQEIDCDRAQGFLMSRPMTGEKALEWAQHHLTSWR